MKGKVSWFNDMKGYGFLVAEDGTSVFVHYSNIVGSGRKTLVEGQPVEFEVQSNEKGPRAVSVVPGEPSGN